MKLGKWGPVPAVVVVAGLLVHIPFLLSHGARTWPGPDFSARGVWTSLVFLTLTFLGGLGVKRVCRNRPRRRVGILLALCVLLSVAVQFSLKLPRIWFLLLYLVAAALGWLRLCLLVDDLPEAGQAGRPSDALEKLLVRLSLLAAIYLVCAVGYSLSVYCWLPSLLGGDQSHYVRFKVKAGLHINVVNLYRFGRDDLTQPFLLLYRGKEHLWLKCHGDASEQTEVRRVKVADFGEPYPCSTGGSPRSKSHARPKRWEMKMPHPPDE